jgi:UDP-N-acetylmuramoylalanine--D-glutamate ligase
MKKDHDKEQMEELEKLGIHFVLGEHPDDLLDESFDYLIKNPGVPIDHKYVLKARELGVEVINEAEMAYRLFPKGINLIAITGTNGKTTTTTLIYKFLVEDKRRTHLTGNIGYPLSSFLDKLEKDDIVVMETSCQQLENLSTFKPNVAVMTNLSPAHVDFFKTYDNYKRVKAKLFQNQTKEDVAILNLENEDVLNETKNIKSTVKYFSSKKEIDGAYLKDDAIYYYGEKIIDTKDIVLIGVHNYENIMAAIMAVKEFGVKNSSIVNVLKTFTGVEHRLEFVRNVNNRKFYNDTEATNIKCSQIALSSFKEDIYLILGGLERGQNFDDLTDYIKNVKGILAIGQCRDRVEEFAKKNNIPVIVSEYLKDGFNKLYEMSTENSVILLSPASASWDQYKECEVRGKEFKDLANKL